MAWGKKAEKVSARNAANLGFEQKPWHAADNLRGNMDAADYKHVVVGLIFLKYISDAFLAQPFLTEYNAMSLFGFLAD